MGGRQGGLLIGPSNWKPAASGKEESFVLHVNANAKHIPHLQAISSLQKDSSWLNSSPSQEASEGSFGFYWLENRMLLKMFTLTVCQGERCLPAYSFNTLPPQRPLAWDCSHYSAFSGTHLTSLSLHFPLPTTVNTHFRGGDTKVNRAHKDRHLHFRCPRTACSFRSDLYSSQQEMS